MFTHLGVSLGAVERLELLGDGVELTDAGLVNEKVEEVGGEGVERSLLAELGEDVLLFLPSMVGLERKVLMAGLAAMYAERVSMSPWTESRALASAHASTRAEA